MDVYNYPASRQLDFRGPEEAIYEKGCDLVRGPARMVLLTCPVDYMDMKLVLRCLDLVSLVFASIYLLANHIILVVLVTRAAAAQSVRMGAARHSWTPSEPDSALDLRSPRK